MQYLENLALAGVLYLLTWLQSADGIAVLEQLIKELETRVQAAEADLSGQPAPSGSAPSTPSSAAPTGATVGALPPALRGAVSSVPNE